MGKTTQGTCSVQLMSRDHRQGRLLRYRRLGAHPHLLQSPAKPHRVCRTLCRGSEWHHHIARRLQVEPTRHPGHHHRNTSSPHAPRGDRVAPRPVRRLAALLEEARRSKAHLGRAPLDNPGERAKNQGTKLSAMK